MNLKSENVKYGSTIQLEHFLSHKFLTLKPKENSETDKDNIKLSLTDFGDQLTHFKIIAGFKHQKEGDSLVRYGDSIILEVYVPELGRSAYIQCNYDRIEVHDRFSKMFGTFEPKS